MSLTFIYDYIDMISKIIPDCRQERGNCQICWSATATTDFDVSGKQIYIQTMKRPLILNNLSN